MGNSVGKSKSITNTSKTAKKPSAKDAKAAKVAPKTKAKKAPKTIASVTVKNASKTTTKKLKIDSNSKLLLICVAAIVIILVIALVASAVKNKKTDINADMDIYSPAGSCSMIVREDDGKRPASGSTIVVKDSKQFRDMLSQYSYLKKFNLPEPKVFSDASYVYVYAVDSIADEGLKLGDVTIQNKNANIEVKYDERKLVECVMTHLFVIRVEDKTIENANFSTVAD